ncbi:MAG: TRAP transporter large permease [Betaproteobacteria bacterium]|nr:MAG: TRAP transporter large permease [Betaproteobacteria bacterium]
MPDWLLVFIALFAFIAVGVPIPMSIGVSALVGFWLVDIPVITLAQSAYIALNNVPIMAVPLFVLAGALMERGGLADRLVRFAQSLVGNYDGALGIVAVLACMFFAAISGSGPATAAAVGTVTLPAMARERYPAALGGAIIASGGALGSLIPPSNLMVIYGIVASVSIPKLFLAGVIPGIIAGLLLMVVVWVIARRKRFRGSGQRISAARVRATAWEGKWALLAPVVILGGIYGGAFTPTEAAAVAVFYALLTGLVIYRELTWQGIVESLRLTTLICGAIVIMLGPAIAFGQLGALMQIPEQIGALMGGLADQPLTVLLVVTVVFVITGTFMDSIAQIILFTPLFLPLATQAGVDPITLGIIIVLTCEIGFLTPPVGANLFVAMRLARVPLGAVSVAVLPFLLAYFAVVALVSFVPRVALLLPELMGQAAR